MSNSQATTKTNNNFLPLVILGTMFFAIGFALELTVI
jgi:hypothetical protein